MRIRSNCFTENKWEATQDSPKATTALKQSPFPFLISEEGCINVIQKEIYDRRHITLQPVLVLNIRADIKKSRCVAQS
jgi:hypothetical protein